MDIKDRNKCIFILAVNGVVIVLLAILLFVRAVQWRRYIEVDAKIEEIEIDDTDNCGGSREYFTIYITYSYSYEGKEYTTKQQVFSEYGLEKGDRKKIRIDPEKPNVVFNAYQAAGALAVEILYLFFVFVYILIKKKK